MAEFPKQYRTQTWGPSTKAIHIGSEPDGITGSIMPSIHQTTTYVQQAPGEHQGYEYSRSHNPTRTRLEQCLASLEHADYCLVTSSGMAAINLVIHLLSPQDTVLCGDDVYGGTARLLTKVLSGQFKSHFVDTTDLNSVSKAISTYQPKLLWLETPTNPMLKISDIKAIAHLCRQQGVLLAVDNTFMSPYFQNPLTLGADIVVHSLTKYINGHSDVVGGAIMLSDPKLYQQLWFLQNATGPSASPFDSWLVLRGLKTLALRMQAHAASAMQLANYLEQHPAIARVYYPGLTSHPQHQLAAQQMKGFGGMISFNLKGGKTKALDMLKKVKLFSLAESLGGVESLIEHPAIMTHASVPADRRQALGIDDGLLRISVGIEDVQDLLADLEQGLL